MRPYLLIALLVVLGFSTKSQDLSLNTEPKSDSVLYGTIPAVTVMGKRFANNADLNAFNHLRYNVGVVYPYAKMAGEIYHQMQDDMADMSKRRDKKRYKKDEEKELRNKFEASIKNLTQTQGKLLVKLINRETGNNCYDVLKTLKNPASAFFYQIGAKAWGYNLKEEYKPSENRDLEYIVLALEHQQPIR